jgi:hypothetical protein
MRRSGLLAGHAGAAADPANAADLDEVDILLVLAIDASGSLSDERLRLQREGHARAVDSPTFLRAIAAGPLGRIAITVIEWSNEGRQDQIVPWMLVRDDADTRALAQRVMRAPHPIPGYTSISGAIDRAAHLLAQAPYAAARRVIDVSGNGPNNDGRPVHAARDAAAAMGITVNGLPILDGVAGLDAYFAQQVIGGPDAFMVPAHDLQSFEAAIRRKLLAEIALLPSRLPDAGIGARVTGRGV